MNQNTNDTVRRQLYGREGAGSVEGVVSGVRGVGDGVVNVFLRAYIVRKILRSGTSRQASVH